MTTKTKPGEREVHFMFFLFTGGTELAKIPGLSYAGTNPEVVPLTAPADADVIQYGFPKTIDRFPMDPEGHPTPAIITRAAILEAEIPYCVVKAGTYLPPSPPYVELGADFGKNPCREPAVPDAAGIFERAKCFAESTARHHRSLMLAETVPGGTTTALLALRAMGYDDMVSSAGPGNPTALKEKMWRLTSERIGIEMGDLSDDPIRIITEMGDPVQAAILGFISGLPEDCDITLAGGTQMLAVAAMLQRLDEKRKPLVATTIYVARDASSSFTKLADKLGVKTWIAPLDFSQSPYKGLSDYEKGYIKEGVGAGGAVLYAQTQGVPVERIVSRANALYSEIEEKARRG